MRAMHLSGMSNASPMMVVLCGGASDERDVSLVSGQAVYAALLRHYAVEKIELAGNILPHNFPSEGIVFPVMHGAFGEDGELQGLLEEQGVTYVGCDAQASALCMDKAATKAAVRGTTGFDVGAELVFSAAHKPATVDIVAKLGDDVVFKPLDSGSSVGLRFAHGTAAIDAALVHLRTGRWMVEARVVGREMTIGVLQGKALGIVEIVPLGGAYDYHHKYTQGATAYRVPVALSPAAVNAIEASAERVFAVCGCRDFARIDFIFDAAGRAHFLEVNTIPGLTPTSLFPKSASQRGFDFDTLVSAMVAPAVARWKRYFDCLH